MGKNNSYAETEEEKGQGKQPVKKTRYLIIVGVAVVLLALVAGIVLKSRSGGVREETVSVREVRHEYEGRNGFNDDYVVEYNEYGDVLKSYIYNRDFDEIEELTEYGYNDYGDLIYEKTYNSEGTLISSTEYTRKYDIQNRLTKCTASTEDSEWVVYSTEDSKWTKTYKYDKNGNYSRIITYDSDGNVDDYTEYEYEYDENGNNTRIIRYDSDGNVDSHTDYEYDENGNCIKITGYSVYSDGSEMVSGITEYDANGNVILYYENFSSFRHEYTYDEFGNVTARYLLDEFGERESCWSFENIIDEEGNILQITIYDDSDGEKVFDWEYEYFTFPKTKMVWSHYIY